MTLRRLRPVAPPSTGWVPSTTAGRGVSQSVGDDRPSPDRRTRLRAVADRDVHHREPTADGAGQAPATDGGDACAADPPFADGGTERSPDPARTAADATGSTADPAGAAVDDIDGVQPAWAARMVRRGSWGALAERWVPEPLRGARVDPGRRGAVLLSVIATLAALVAAVGVWWGRPQPRPVAPAALAPAESGAPASGAGPAPSADARVSASGLAPAASGDGDTASAPGSGSTVGAGGPPGAGTRGTSASATSGPIVVSVTGRVHHPGLVRLTSDARVADAITAAGGALDPADLTGLNLAAHLSDGDSVVVAGPAGSTVDTASSDAPDGAPAGTPAPGATTAPVDVNTADATALDSLPGVGPVTAAAIIAWRTEHGPFTNIEQLQAIPGIGPAKYAQIAPHVTISP